MPLAPKPTVVELQAAAVRLGVRVDGALISSLSGLGCPVSLHGRPAYLKVTNEPEELIGARALEKWDGRGAVRLIGREGNAILLERAGETLRSSLTDDAAVTEVLCAVADRLHAHTCDDLDGFPTLRRWFSTLLTDTTPRLDRTRVIARRLLVRSTPPVLLHGDLHPENVLDGGPRGWLAIDPKGIAGPREFDYCNIFTNATPAEAIQHFDSRLHLVATIGGIDRNELLQWIASWSALSGVWHLEDGNDDLAAFPLTIMELAFVRL